MAIEIERKFLLANDNWRALVSHTSNYRQGYLSSQPTCSIRVRISDDCAWINIKSAVAGTHRHEYEYKIPVSDAEEIIANLCKKPIIEKQRHIVINDSNTWEIDEFSGINLGLCVAEIELSSIDQPFSTPEWLGVEVTHDLRYYNNNLITYPYSEWQDK